MRRLRSTTTKAPNPPHNTVQTHTGKRPGASESSRRLGKPVDPQPHSRRTVGGGGDWEGKLAPRACWHGGGNPPLTPTLWPVECEAEDDRITPTEPGRRLAQGGRSYLEDRGALRAQPCHGGWGRLGERIVNSRWIAQGGCTLSQPASTSARGQIRNHSVSNRARSDNKNRNQIKVYELDTVDGKGGTRESSRKNNLNESFQGVSCKERQAQPNPQNLVGWCPGSSLTNLSDSHPRAELERPTSADEVYFEMRSRLDHPRSHQCSCEHRPADWARLSSKPGSRRYDRKNLKNQYDDCGFHFGSGAFNKR